MGGGEEKEEGPRAERGGEGGVACGELRPPALQPSLDLQKNLT